MKTLRSLSATALVALWAANAWGQTAPRPPQLEEVGTLSLPARTTEVGEVAVDTAGARLFVALPDQDRVAVWDVPEGSAERHLSVPRPRALWYEERPKLLYVGTDASGGQIKILDVEAERPLKTIGRLPDVVRIRRDLSSFRIYAAYGEGALAVIHADTGVHTLSILLPDRAADLVLERVGSRIFVSLPRSNALAVVDRLTREMSALWKLEGVSGPGPLALDEEGARLYVACEAPTGILVWDTQKKQEVLRLPTNGRVRWLFVDPARRRLVAGTDAGEARVWQVGEDGRHIHLGTLPLVSRRTTAAYDGRTGTLYVAAPRERHRPADVRLYRWRQ